MRPILEHVAPKNSGWLSWLETVLITLLTLLLGWLARPEDLLQAYSGFPWSLFGPLLLALRYGFGQGFASATLLLSCATALNLGGYAAYQEIPTSYLVGMFALTMLSGEFRDLWGRRLEGLQRANDYRQMRLDEFTRAHHILRLSHDRLEQRLAGTDQSLRGALLAMQQKLGELPQSEDPLTSQAGSILELLAHYGSLHKAALYRVSDDKLQYPALAQIGEMPEVATNDPLLHMLLERRQLISVRPELLEQDARLQQTPLLAGIPLLDVHERLHAVVLVQLIPFFAFNERNLNLLAVLCAHIADILSNTQQARKVSDHDFFFQKVQRTLLDARRFDQSSSLIAFELTDPKWAETILHSLQKSRRGLDLLYTTDNRNGHHLILALLPLTSAIDAQGYLMRVEQLLHANFGLPGSELGVRPHLYSIDERQSASSLREFLDRECALT